MIDIKNKTYGDVVWVLDDDIEKMLYPKEVLFDSLESDKSNKLAFVRDGVKKICYPTSMLFDDKVEAEISAVIKFIKLYDTGELDFEHPKLPQLFEQATKLADKYETSHPDKFLYHWMNHVSEI